MEKKGFFFSFLSLSSPLLLNACPEVDDGAAPEALGSFLVGVAFVPPRTQKEACILSKAWKLRRAASQGGVQSHGRVWGLRGLWRDLGGGTSTGVIIILGPAGDGMGVAPGRMGTVLVQCGSPQVQYRRSWSY